MRFLQPVVHERTKNCTPWSLPGQKRWKWRRGGIGGGQIQMWQGLVTASSASVTMCPRVTPDHKSGKHQIYKSTQVTRCGAQVHKSWNMHSRQRSVRHRRIGDQSPITAQCFVHSHQSKEQDARRTNTKYVRQKSPSQLLPVQRFKTDLLASRLDQAIMY